MGSVSYRYLDFNGGDRATWWWSDIADWDINSITIPDACGKKAWDQTEPGEMMGSSEPQEEYCLDIASELRNPGRGEYWLYNKQIGGGSWYRIQRVKPKRRSVSFRPNVTADAEKPTNKTHGCRRALPMTVFGYEEPNTVWAKDFVNETELKLFEKAPAPQKVCQPSQESPKTLLISVAETA